MKPLYYLKKLIKNGHYWQYTDVLNNGKKPKMFFLPLQWIIIAASILIAIFFIDDGFSNEFVGYTNAVLAILTGLYLSVIVNLFAKFDKEKLIKKMSKQKLTVMQKNNLIARKNYFIQFTSLTMYSILIALFCLVMLSLSLLFESFDTRVSIDTLKENWQIVQYSCLLKLLVIIFYRIILLYFLINLVYLSSYIVSSVYSYIVGEYNEVKIGDIGDVDKE